MNVEPITVDRLNDLAVNGKLYFTGNTQVIRNTVYRFHKKYPDKRVRVFSSINVVVRLV